MLNGFPSEIKATGNEGLSVVVLASRSSPLPIRLHVGPKAPYRSQKGK